MKLNIIAIVLLAAGSTLLFGQDADRSAAKKKAASSGELFEAIARLDAATFDAFNAHDVERLMTMFTNDLEFYDDGGAGPAGTREVAAGFRKMFANVPDLHRELLPGTLEVYPLKGYGAIEVGEQRFCHDEKGKQDCGITKFSMVWRESGDGWKLARVLSYGH